MSGTGAGAARPVRLRAVEPEDWPLLREVAREDDADPTARRQPPRSDLATRRLAEELSEAAAGDDRRALVVESADGTTVALVSVEEADRQNGVIRHGIHVLGRYRGRGFGRAGLRALLCLYLVELGYEKAEGEVVEGNEASAALHESLGFQLEGRRREAWRVGGERRDVLVYGITRAELLLLGGAGVGGEGEL